MSDKIKNETNLQNDENFSFVSNNTSSNNEMIEDYLVSLNKKEKQTSKKFKFKRKPMYKKHKPLLIILSVVLALILSLGTIFMLDYFGVIRFGIFSPKAVSVDIIPNSTGEEVLNRVEPTRPVKIFATTVIAGKDFTENSSLEQIGLMLDNIKSKGLTTIFVNLLNEQTLFTSTEKGQNTLEALLTLSASKELSVFAQVDLSAFDVYEISKPDSLESITGKISTISSIKGLNGLVISGIERNKNGEDFEEYLNLGSFAGYKNYSEQVLTKLVKSISFAVKKANPSLYLNILCDSVYKSENTSESGLKNTSEKELLRDQNADVLLWLKEKYFDGAFVNVTESTDDKSPSFNDVISWWNENIPENSDIGFVLSADLAVKGEGGFKNPDQLTRQLMALNKLNRYTFCFNSYSAMEADTTEASSVAFKYLGGGISNDYILSSLTVTSPKSKNVTVYENQISFVGASDPNFKISLNGEELERTEYGYFSVTKELKVGKNTFKFEHKGSVQTYTVNYKYVVIKSYYPNSAVTMESNSTLIVKAVARNQSTVSATLGGKTVALAKSESEEESDFATYIGTIPLGEYAADTNLGKITFSGTQNGVSDKYTGGSVTVKKKYVPPVNSAVNSVSANDYIGVGNTLIAEVVKDQIETFTGSTFDDFSQPNNSYLPKGTVDYCSEKTIYDPSSKNTYRTLRYGKRVYSSENKGNIRTLRGSLPEYNTLNATKVTTDGQYTTLTLDCLWKAPFTVNLTPQSYQGQATISSRTFKYLDITFCYASKFDGDLSKLSDSPVFSKAELIKNTSDYTLRLHLRKTGEFYGWIANYNSSGDLVFEFLNPKKAQAANNLYGGTLNGITIAVDAGHGGSDSGAIGSNPNFSEANRNLILAQMLKTKLESIGAKVVMTRTDNSTIDRDTRVARVRAAKANLAVSVHRDSALNTSARGFGSYYFNPYTQLPAQIIKDSMEASKAHYKTSLKSHVFFLSRISNCPVVLTENGFMSNSADFNLMMDDNWNSKCADAIVKGIVKYFLTIG